MTSLAGHSAKESLVGGRFQLGGKIGFGSFGDIHMATNVQTAEMVAVKVEPVSSKRPRLLYEAKIYKSLAGGAGVPNVYWSGSLGAENAMVMDLLGPSLEDHIVYCKQKLGLKTILMLGEQMLSCAEHIHACGYIHRDVKPDNFLMGLGDKANSVYVIDLGLAKPWEDAVTEQHIPYRRKAGMAGTARYASINTHAGDEQSRRDDLESIGYTLLYLFNGRLPWQGIPASTKNEKYEKIARMKKSIAMTTLCKGLPAEFVTYFNYVRSLSFMDQPNYAYLRSLLKEAFVRERYECDWIYDWMLPSASAALPKASRTAPKRKRSRSARRR